MKWVSNLGEIVVLDEHMLLCLTRTRGLRMRREVGQGRFVIDWSS